MKLLPRVSKVSFLSIVATALCAVVFHFSPYGVVSAAEQSIEKYVAEVQLKDEGIQIPEIEELLEGIEYSYSELSSEIKIGSETITDTFIKPEDQSIDDVNTEYGLQRESLLINLLNSPDTTESDKQEVSQKLGAEEFQNISLDRVRVVSDSESEIKQLVERKSLLPEIQDIKESKERIHEQVEELRDQSRSIEDLKKDRRLFDRFQIRNFIGSVMNFFAPYNYISAEEPEVPAWVPDFTSISFFDTDEIGVNPYKEWYTIPESQDYMLQDAVSHWWRTYIIATKDGKTYLGKFNDEQGVDFNGWQELTNIPLDSQNHKIESHNNRLYLGYTVSDEIKMQSSWDGGNSWADEREVGVGEVIGFDFTSHNGKICMAITNSSKSVKASCVDDGWWDWYTAEWSETSISVSDRAPTIESAFGGLWVANQFNILDSFNRMYVSYDNGETWQFDQGSNDRIGTTPTLVAIGSSEFNNEKLCIGFQKGRLEGGMNIGEGPTSGGGGSSEKEYILETPVFQKCLTRYGSEYDQWNWGPVQDQQALSEQPLIFISDSSRLIQIHQTLDNTIQSRTLEWQNPGGRGYISHIRWDENPGFKEGIKDFTGGPDSWVVYPEGYEHEVILNNYIYDSDKSYINDGELYLDDFDLGFDAVIPEMCLPVYRYWASNLPGAYVDTRLNYSVSDSQELLRCDSQPSGEEGKGEISYTIGSEFGSDIEPNADYFAYINTYKGNLYKPVFKVQGSITDLVYDSPLALGYDGTWSAFYKDTVFILRDDDVWYNDEEWVNQGNTYPYWYLSN